MDNSLKIVPDNLDKMVANVFKEPEERRTLVKYATAVYSNDEKLKNLDPKQVMACILQMYLRGADPTNGEAYLIGYKTKNGATNATIQTGYKFAEKKLFETGILKVRPKILELKEGELETFTPEERDITYNIQPIKNYEASLKRATKDTIGYLVRFELTSGEMIEKFYWKNEVVEHCKKYSKSYGGSIWKTNAKEMFKKTVFMMAYREFLPKSSNLNKAIQDINALNLAAYNEINENAKPVYIDNPQTKEIPIVKKSSNNEFVDKLEVQKFCLDQFKKYNLNTKEKKDELVNKLKETAKKLSKSEEITINNIPKNIWEKTKDNIVVELINNNNDDDDGLKWI